MAYFEWADDLVIDQGLIDQDHRHLIELVNTLHTATSQGCGQEVVGRLLQALTAYTQEHFQREEQVMACVHFPHLAGHQQLHRQFMADLAALQSRYEMGSIATAAQLSSLLRDWLSLHIRRSDRKLREYLLPRSKWARTDIDQAACLSATAALGGNE
ncbi:bacteriohemerythrin [Aquabacterium sp.]|uniref:bacteriohemerythrin n=1 Tax=Aquabacterium sp. TaxID=1872578 RepID=UPI0025BD8547|nr:bacteriohemerythrin [Aquabacterium sp.]MBI5923973.1 hemerythrin family protein [Aquabacterium sp.]